MISGFPCRFFEQVEGSKTKAGRGDWKVDNLLRKPHNLMRKTVGFARKEDAFSGPMLKIDAPVGGSVMHLGTSRRFLSRTRRACSRASLSKGHLFTDRSKCLCCSGLAVKSCPRFFLHPLCDRPHLGARLGHACLAAQKPWCGGTTLHRFPPHVPSQNRVEQRMGFSSTMDSLKGKNKSVKQRSRRGGRRVVDAVCRG